MTITQLSNLFNLIVQNDAEYNFYHYGWPSDMNLNIQNNSDPNALTGRLFPYVLFMPPAVQARAMDNNVNSIFDTYTCELLITDTYAYNQGVLTYKADTTIEIEQKLQVLAKKLIQYLLDYSNVSIPPFNVSDYNIEFDPYRFTNDTRSIRIRLTLVFPAICDDSSLDISFLPDDLSDIDTDDAERTPNLTSYCPIGWAEDTLISTEIDGLNLWTLSADCFNWIEEIKAHPNYVGNIAITAHKVVDSGGNVSGAQVAAGSTLSCSNLNQLESELYYYLEVEADFDFLAGTRTLIFTLSEIILKPTLGDPPVSYNSNSYTCEDTLFPT
jgi:hypothetical protein